MRPLQRRKLAWLKVLYLILVVPVIVLLGEEGVMQGVKVQTPKTLRLIRQLALRIRALLATLAQVWGGVLVVLLLLLQERLVYWLRGLAPK